MRLLASIALTLALLAGRALAQEAAEPGVEDVLRSALAAYEAGELERARELFEAVHAREPSARTLRGLGVVALRQERFVDAALLLEASLHSPVKPLSPDIARSVERLLERATAEVGELELRIVPDGASVQIDGADPTWRAPGSALVAPGTHEVAARAAGHLPGSASVAVEAGGRQLVELALTPLEVEPAPPAVAPPPPVEPLVLASAPEPKRKLRRWGYGLLAGAAATLITSGVTLALWDARVEDIEAMCRDQLSETCSTSQYETAWKGHRMPGLVGVTLGGAVLGTLLGAGGASLLVVARRRNATDVPGKSLGSLELQLGVAF